MCDSSTVRVVRKTFRGGGYRRAEKYGSTQARPSKELRIRIQNLRYETPVLKSCLGSRLLAPNRIEDICITYLLCIPGMWADSSFGHTLTLRHLPIQVLYVMIPSVLSSCQDSLASQDSRQQHKLPHSPGTLLCAPARTTCDHALARVILQAMNSIGEPRFSDLQSDELDRPWFPVPAKFLAYIAL